MSSLALPFRKALATNATSTAFTAQNASTTAPSGVGVFDLCAPDLGIGTAASVSQRLTSFLQLVPFGTAADNKTFDMRLWGFNPTTDSTPIYIPQLLLDISVTLCAITATPIAANTFLADTITVNKGPADNAEWRSLISNANDTVASVLIHTRGCRYIKFDFDADAGAAASTDCNCLWRPTEY